MLNTMKNVLLSVLVVLLGMGSLSGQTSIRKAQATFSCATWEKMFSHEVYYRFGKKYAPVSFIMGRRSEAYPLAPGEEFALYKQVQNEEGETTYVPVVKCKVPRHGGKLLVILEKVTNAAGKSKVYLFPMDDAVQNFPRGTYKFVNFVRRPLDVSFGKVQKTIAPAKNVVVDPKIPSSGGFVPLYVRFPNSSKVVLEESVYGQYLSRCIVILSESKNPRRPMRMRFLNEVVPQEE